MGKLNGLAAMVTGASSGFGEAIARALGAEGADVAIGARRLHRLKPIADEIRSASQVKVLALPLDVRSTEQVQVFVHATLREFGKIDILVNNAGLALNRRSISDGDEEDWKTMMDTNVMGMFRMTREVLKHMTTKRSGQIVNIGSIAGRFAYEGGGGYCSSKFAASAFSQILRMETLGQGIKVINIDPGLAETEFSLVRFGGDAEKAKKVYEGMTPLTGKDVADVVLFALTRPPHVVLDDILITPIDQAGIGKVHRKG